MVKKVVLKTSENNASVKAYVDSLPDEKSKKEARALVKLFTEVTGKSAKMWGASIVGFGKYTYYRSNGDVGEFMATGFSIRKSGPTIYIMPGYQEYSSLLKDIGPHKLGKSCLYLKGLEETNLAVLNKLIKRGLMDLKKTHQVS